MSLRRLIVGGVLLTTVLLARPLPLEASPHTQLNRLVNGPFTGSGTIDFSDPSCDGLFSVQDYVYRAGRTPIRSGSVHVVVCVDTSVSPSSVQGTFKLVTRTGATLRGTIVGTATTSSFHNTYTVSSGTGIFRRVIGTIDANATFGVSGDTLLNIEGTYSGSLERAGRPC